MHPTESNSRSMKMTAAALTLALLSALLLIASRPARSQTYSVLYSFTGKPDGANPYAGVASDKTGNVYGTTYVGGIDNLGTASKFLQAVAKPSCTAFKGGSGDGANPHAGVTLDKKGNLYGIT